MGIPLKILFEDDHLLVIDKPSGIHSAIVADSANDSVAEELLKIYPNLSAVCDNVDEAGLINRLDFETSGILLVAKTRKDWIRLRELQNSGRIEKSYLALVEGSSAKSETIDAYIGTPHRRGKKVRVFADEPSKKMRALPASTAFKTVGVNSNLSASLIVAYIHQGRRHQIRAHSSFRGYPLLGDSLYGSRRSLSEILPDLKRDFFLHSWKVMLIHPESDQELNIESPPLEEVRRLF